MCLVRNSHQLQLVAVFTLVMLYSIGYLIQCVVLNTCPIAKPSEESEAYSLQGHLTKRSIRSRNLFNGPSYDGQFTEGNINKQRAFFQDINRTDIKQLTVSTNEASSIHNHLSSSGQICSNSKLLTPMTVHIAGWKSFTSKLEKYKHFHKHQLALMKDGEHWLPASGIRTLTWACTDTTKCSGLADQLYRIQFSLLLAIIFNRVFLIRWSTESDIYQYLQPNKIDWAVRIHNIPLDQERKQMSNLVHILESSTQHVVIGNEIPVPFSRSLSRARRFSRLNKGFKRLGLSHTLNLHQNLVYVMGTLLQYLFKFLPELIDEVDRLQATMGLISHQYLAIHVRTGFSGNVKYEETGKFGGSKILRDPEIWRNMFSCSLKLARERTVQKSAIFLATDSILVKQVSKDYGNHIKTINTTAFHSAYCKGKCGKGVWIDFILLARANYMIRGGSGFSKIASAFCSMSSKNQCTPNCNCHKI